MAFNDLAKLAPAFAGLGQMRNRRVYTAPPEHDWAMATAGSYNWSGLMQVATTWPAQPLPASLAPSNQIEPVPLGKLLEGLEQSGAERIKQFL